MRTSPGLPPCQRYRLLLKPDHFLAAHPGRPPCAHHLQEHQEDGAPRYGLARALIFRAPCTHYHLPGCSNQPSRSVSRHMNPPGRIRATLRDHPVHFQFQVENPAGPGFIIIMDNHGTDNVDHVLYWAFMAGELQPENGPWKKERFLGRLSVTS